MAKRKSTSKWWEKLIIAIVCIAVACFAGLYVWLTFRATAVEKKTATVADKYFSILYVDYDNTLILSDLYGEGFARQIPVEPTREGYTFQGWETEESSTIFTTQATLNMLITHDITFTAIYLPIEYSVKYLNDDLSELQTLKYSAGQDMPVIDNPTKEGYIFTGWDYGINGKETTAVAMYIDSASDYICRVGNTYYTDLQEAINSIEEIPYSLTDNEMYYRARDVFETDKALDLVYFDKQIIHLFRDYSFDTVTNRDFTQNMGNASYSLIFNLINDVKLSGNFFFNKSYALFNTNNYNLEINNIETYKALCLTFKGNNSKVDSIKLSALYAPDVLFRENLNLGGSLEANIDCNFYGAVVNFLTSDSLDSKLRLDITFEESIELKNEKCPLVESDYNIENISDVINVYATNTSVYNLNKDYASGVTVLGNPFSYWYWTIGEIEELPFTQIEISQVITADITEKIEGESEVASNFNARYLDAVIEKDVSEIKLHMSAKAYIYSSGNNNAPPLNPYRTDTLEILFSKGSDGIYRAEIENDYISTMTIDLSLAKPTLQISAQGNNTWYYETLTITLIEVR